MGLFYGISIDDKGLQKDTTPILGKYLLEKANTVLPR